MDELAVAAYWGRTALAGAVVLGVGRVALLVARSPLTRQRLAAGTLRAAVLVPLLTLLPSWWAITVPAPPPPVAAVEAVAVEPVALPAEPPALPVEWVTVPEFVEVEAPALDAVEPVRVAVEPEPVAVVVPPREFTWRDGVAVLAAGYAVGVAYFLGVFALGHFALVRLRRGATVAPSRVRAVWGPRRPPALLVHEVLASPVCFGVVRPAVVLPAGLAQSATAEQLAWVLAHEAEHLRRGDPLTGWFAGLAKALFFFAPWFWGVRRELRLAQEYLADAAALAAGGHAADYAEFLVDLTAAPVRGRRTSLAHGVRAGRSDLSRRITMVLSTTPPPAARRWATPAAIGLFAVAVALSGVTIVRAENPPTPAERLNASRLDGWLVIAKAALTEDKSKPPEDKPRAETKPADVERLGVGKVLVEHPGNVWQIQSSDGRVDVAVLRKRIDEALAAGKTDAAKKLIDILVAALAPPMPPAAPKPPAVPQPPAREGRGVLAIESADPRIMEALTAMRKAIDATKDPEARAAMETAFKLLRDMPQERKLTQTVVGGDGRATIYQHGMVFSDPVGSGLLAPAQVPTPNALRVRVYGPGVYGVVVAPLSEALTEQLQLPAGVGLVVTAVVPDSGFAKAGVKKSDVITSVGSVRLTGGEKQLLLELSKAEAGKLTTVEVVSRGVKKTVEVELPQPPVLARPTAKKVRFESKSLSVNDNTFSIDATAGEVQYRITGQIVNGLIENYTVTIKDGDNVIKFTQAGEPVDLKGKGEKYRPAVQSLLDSVRGN